MKKIGRIFLIFIWFMAVVQIFRNDMESEKSQDVINIIARDNLSSAGFAYDTEITAFSFMQEGYIEHDDKIELLKDIASSLAIEKGYSIVTSKVENGVETELSLDGRNAYTSIKITSIEDKVKTSVSQYVTISIKVYNNTECAMSYKNALEDIMAGLGMYTESYVNITGITDGEVALEDMIRITNSIIEENSAVIVQENKDPDNFYVYAYTKEFHEYIESMGDKINLNITFSYNETDDVTYMYLSIPVINFEY